MKWFCCLLPTLAVLACLTAPVDAQERPKQRPEAQPGQERPKQRPEAQPGQERPKQRPEQPQRKPGQERPKQRPEQPRQRGQVAPGRGGDALFLIDNADVQKDLQLTEEQVKKLRELTAKQQAALAEIRGTGDREKYQDAVQKHNKAVSEILTEKQSQRLRQLDLQRRGAQALFDPQVAREIGMDREQFGKIRDIMGEHSKEFQALRERGVNREEAQKKMAEINKKMLDEATKVLTAEQQAKWRELTGTPFAGTLPSGPAFAPAAGRVRPDARPETPPRKRGDN